VWRFLGSHDEAAHYALIAGLVQRFAPRARLLDAGCGTGLLYDLLRHTSLASYRGVDVSPEAIRDATARLACDRATFAVADFESAVPSAGAYDAIVFNESIYYAADPAGTLRSYLDAVGVDGVVIVSVRRRRRNRRIVQALRRSGPPALSACVGNRRRQRWDVDVYGKPGQPAAARE
jgi:2-polyprenyl-6-hydroxyphenyl methylase/3-demethylubiquinone-9 3-methyltransferase